jgi:NADH-quinone oxidoreductase subunit C
MNQTKTALEELQGKFTESIIGTSEYAGDITVIVKPDMWFDILDFLKHDSTDKYDYMSDLCGVDFLDRKPRFDVVVHLISMTNFQRIRVKTSVDVDEELESVSRLWLTADWHEREAFDLVGIKFKNHPNLVRILLPDDFLGHPLQKDYPLSAADSAKKQEELKAALKAKSEVQHG